MTLVVEMAFGSTVYGANLPSSDVDYKRIYLPSGRDIVMCRPKLFKEPDKRGKLDKEEWSLSKYMALLAEGQTGAFDMLFTPKEHWVASSRIWRELQENRDKLIHKGIDAFLGYCKSQAEKYSLRGDRINVLERLLDGLKFLKQDDPVQFYALDLVKLAGDEKYVKVESVAQNVVHEQFLVICGKKVNYHNKIKVATELTKKLLEGYGDRARKAATEGGLDTKAYYHAVRIAYEAEELLLTGNITFPRPEAKLLLDIRGNRISYEEVCAIVEQKNLDVLAAEKKSTLPAQPDHDFIERFVYKWNLWEILNYHTYDYKSEFEHD